MLYVLVMKDPPDAPVPYCYMYVYLILFDMMPITNCIIIITDCYTYVRMSKSDSPVKYH